MVGDVDSIPDRFAGAAAGYAEGSGGCVGHWWCDRGIIRFGGVRVCVMGLRSLLRCTASRIVVSSVARLKERTHVTESRQKLESLLPRYVLAFVL